MKSILFSFVFVFLSLSLILLNSCSAENMSHQYKNVPRLFAYKQAEILDYLKKKGYADFRPDGITRDSSGTTLFVHNLCRDDKRSLILSISEGKKMKMYVSPSAGAYMNGKGEFVAWPADIKRGIHFKDGKFRSLPVSGYFGVAPGGQFFYRPHDRGGSSK